jgi:cytosine/adenosine deaminase-related metal-dependent hydrolase
MADQADQIGTLEPGKLADIILIDGNPTLNIYEMLTTKVVLKEGKVVVDKRQASSRLRRKSSSSTRQPSSWVDIRPETLILLSHVYPKG